MSHDYSSDHHKQDGAELEEKVRPVNIEMLAEHVAS